MSTQLTVPASRHEAYAADRAEGVSHEEAVHFARIGMGLVDGTNPGLDAVLGPELLARWEQTRPKSKWSLRRSKNR